MGMVYSGLSFFQTSALAQGGAADGGGCSEGSICNPLSADDIPGFIMQIIEVLLVFAVPLIVLYIMYAGYLFVTAQGNEEQISHAKSALLYALVGGVLVLGANLIIEVVQGTVDALQ